MTGNESINLGLSNIYHSWTAYRKGKKATIDLDIFQYHLEKELFSLCRELNSGLYRHGGYRKFVVCDNKRREVSVASIRDRVVHRLVYDYLTNIYDKTFIFDAWSCRMNKGLTSGLDRTQSFMQKYQNGYVWRADISKFFDSVDQEVLIKILSLKISDTQTLQLLKKIIDSFWTEKAKGMPIGNLTSQIFSNIYLTELDRFIKHTLKCKSYLRYGDDFVIFENDRKNLESIKITVSKFIEANLKLKLHPKNNLIIKSSLKFLGVILYRNGRKLNIRNSNKIKTALTVRNASSYWGVLSKNANSKKLKEFPWRLATQYV